MQLIYANLNNQRVFWGYFSCCCCVLLFFLQIKAVVLVKSKSKQNKKKPVPLWEQTKVPTRSKQWDIPILCRDTWSPTRYKHAHRCYSHAKTMVHKSSKRKSFKSPIITMVIGYFRPVPVFVGLLYPRRRVEDVTLLQSSDCPALW